MKRESWGRNTPECPQMPYQLIYILSTSKSLFGPLSSPRCWLRAQLHFALAFSTAGHGVSPYQGYQDPSGSETEKKGCLTAQDDTLRLLQKLSSYVLLPEPSAKPKCIIFPWHPAERQDEGFRGCEATAPPSWGEMRGKSADWVPAPTLQPQMALHGKSLEKDFKEQRNFTKRTLCVSKPSLIFHSFLTSSLKLILVKQTALQVSP